MNQQFETRYFKSVGSELRVLPTSNGQPAKFTGRAAAFNSPSDDLGGFKEIIAPGAFRDSLSKNGDIRALVGHDPDRLMGRTSRGTLRLTETLDGLHFENDIPDTSYARDLVELARRGDIKGMSFGFRVPKGGDAWAKGSDGRAVRTLKSVDLARSAMSPTRPTAARDSVSGTSTTWTTKPERRRGAAWPAVGQRTSGANGCWP